MKMQPGEHWPYRLRAEAAAKFIRRYHDKHGVSPSLEEIAEAIGYAHKANAHRLVQRMIADGLIGTVGPMVARSIIVEPRTETL